MDFSLQVPPPMSALSTMPEVHTEDTSKGLKMVRCLLT